MSNLHNTIEYINSLSQSDPKELIDRSEQRFKNIIRDVSDKVENDSGLQVVMLAGPSASGKTTTAQKLAEEFTRRGMKTYFCAVRQRLCRCSILCRVSARTRTMK